MGGAGYGRGATRGGWARIAALVAMLGGSCLVACGDDASSDPRRGSEITSEDRALLRSRTGLAIPKSAAWKLFHREQGMDEAVMVKLTLPEDDAEALMKSGPLAGADLDSDSASISDTPQWPGWKPRSSGPARSTQVRLDGGGVLHALVVDAGGEGSADVYFVFHTL